MEKLQILALVFTLSCRAALAFKGPMVTTTELKGTDGFGKNLLDGTSDNLVKGKLANVLSSEPQLKHTIEHTNYAKVHEEMSKLSSMLDAGGDVAAAAIDHLARETDTDVRGHEQLAEDDMGRKIEAKSNAAMLRKLSLFYYDYVDPKKCRPEAAQAALEISNKHNPNDAYGHWLLGASLAAQHNWRDSMTHFRLSEHIRVQALSRKQNDNEQQYTPPPQSYGTACDTSWENIMNWPVTSDDNNRTTLTWPSHLHVTVVHRDDAAAVDAAFAQENGTHWQVVRDDGALVGDLPDTTRVPPRYSPTKTLEVVFRGDVYVREHNGIVYDNLCHVYSSPMENLFGLQRGMEFLRGHGHDDYFDDCQSIPLDVPVIHALNGLSENYYHWMGETLPQLIYLLSSAAKEGSAEPMVLVAKYPHVEQTMALLGIPEERVLYYSAPVVKQEEEEEEKEEEEKEEEVAPLGSCLHFPSGLRLVDFVEQRRTNTIPTSSHFVRSFSKTCDASTPANAASDSDLYYYVDVEDDVSASGKKKRREYLKSGRSAIAEIGPHPAATMRVTPPWLLQEAREVLWSRLDRHDDDDDDDVDAAEILLVMRNEPDGVRGMVGGKYLEELMKRAVKRVFGSDAPTVRTVDPGELTVKEQGRLFRAARLVVAPHGAALANLMFAARGATFMVMPLADDDGLAAQNQVYTHLAASLGVNMLLFPSLGTDFFGKFKVTKEGVKPLIIRLMRVLQGWRESAESCEA
ncbi:glycosyltransferase 61 [Pycnococcus provasolii]|eukprot:CAMPEP_0119194102 /NCGR_PEP_ID=MMETSP1316-20130426/4012_1 /TAXON_ID=41880 /ORGANISM="Pycnococcus provasolii, Strain RCC2336" /LENGTH=742 /DNA_ID=CAMNT_0007189407 /DNA_START=24 /DNA_END=2252 /DNA_ORIENTATION=-